MYDDAQCDDDDDDSTDLLDVILGHVGQRKDAGYVDEGVDVSECWCWFNFRSMCQFPRCQFMYWSRCQGLGLFVAPPPLISLDS